MKALIQILFAFLLVQVLFAASTKAAHASSSPTLDQLIGNQTGKRGQVLTSDGSKTTLQPLPEFPSTPTAPVPTAMTVAVKTDSYTLTSTDAFNTLFVFNNAQVAELTVPADAAAGSTSPVIPIGSIINGIAATNYDVVIKPASGVTIQTPPNGGDRTDGAGARFVLIKTAPNKWSLSGDLYSQTYTMFPGQSLSLAVKITEGIGTPPRTFQWLKNGTEIAGATTPTFTIPSVVADDAGTYTVRVSNTAGSIISGTYILVVAAP